MWFRQPSYQLRTRHGGEDACNVKQTNYAPVKLFGQEYVPETWAMANMNMIIHDMEGQIEIGDTFKNPKFRNEKNGKLRTFDRVVANPMWNQDWFTEANYENDELDRFTAGFPGQVFRRLGLVTAHTRQP